MPQTHWKMLVTDVITRQSLIITHCYQRSPIVSTTEPVYARLVSDEKVVNFELLLIDDEVGGDHDSNHRAHEDRIAAHN